MQTKSRRATTVWLVMIGLILGIVLFSGALAPQAMVILLALYLLTALIAMGTFTSDAFRSRLPQRPQKQEAKAPRKARLKISSAAEQAQARARQAPTYLDQFALVDIGLIASELGSDGLRLKRNNMSLDDQGIQPYAVVYADPSWADETATARFEILDSTGRACFVHEETVYLRTGQNNILSSYRLPLADKAPADANPGLWELRVSLAGGVIGLHTFNLAPSIERRRRMIQGDLERRRGRLEDETAPLQDDSPVSLEDLLRGRQ